VFILLTCTIDLPEFDSTELSSGRLLRTLKGHESWVNAVAISADNQLIISGSQDKTVRVWELHLTSNSKLITEVLKIIHSPVDGSGRVQTRTLSRRLKISASEVVARICDLLLDNNEQLLGLIHQPGNLTTGENDLFFMSNIVSQTSSTRISFFCQLDEAKHPATDGAYQCVVCDRYVCEDCYQQSTTVGVVNCPFCNSKLEKRQ